MKQLVLSTVLLAIIACSGSGGDLDNVTLDAKIDSASYAAGVSIGTGMGTQSVEINTSALFRGILDAYNGEELLLEDSEWKAALRQLQTDARKRQTEQASRQGDDNMAEGIKFLEKNAKNDDVIVLESGLQYRIIESGDGAATEPTSTVSVHYTGTLIDGTVFDSSRDRGAPATFGLDKVIPGWTEGLSKMKVGDRWELFIPSELAYGARGPSPVIGPNSTLIFDVELLEIK